ncbi:MAG: S8 family serine peptidase [Myxococcaceae bacterium]|nr:S8 family serine peptidase [Myxococcaceae bacterium]
MSRLALRTAAATATLGLLVACHPGEPPGGAAASFQTPSAEDVVPGAIVVDFRDGTTRADFDAWEKQWNIDLEFNSIEGEQSGITVAVNVQDVDKVLAEIRKNPAVESAEPELRFRIPPNEAGLELTEARGPGTAGFPNDPLYPKQWNLKAIDAEKAWKRSTGKGVIVAVLDTGIAYETRGDFVQVPDLKGASFVEGYDFVNDTNEPHDDHGHGTHVAGTIAQVTHNSEGVAGVAYEATLMPVKVLDAFGYGTSADIADAIRWAADHGADVINLSLGGGGYSQAMASAIDYARKQGATVVCAAGNGGTGRVEFPAAYPGAVAVSAIGPDGKLAFYSSWGKELDIAAPGGNKQLGDEGGILQNTISARDLRTPVYAFYQGTSMATPHVSGVAALLYAAGAKGPDQVEKALFEGARKVDGQQGWNEKYGHGVVNAEGALEALGTGWLGVNWKPLLTALVLLVGVLLTLGRKQRPGYLNILFTPTFLIPLVLGTVGFFVVRLFTHGASSTNGLVQAAALPIPDWKDVLFGRGRLANPLFYSALIPLVLSMLAVAIKRLRPVIGGLALGFAGFLAYAAWSKAPAIAWLPFDFLAVPWLVVNAAICLFITRAMLRKEVAA